MTHWYLWLAGYVGANLFAILITSFLSFRDMRAPGGYWSMMKAETTWLKLFVFSFTFLPAVTISFLDNTVVAWIASL